MSWGIARSARRRRADWRAACTACLLGLMLLSSRMVLAVDLQRAMRFDIPPQALASALLEFSDQSGIQIITAGAGVAGLRSPGIAGEHTVEAALRQLLRGSALGFRTIGGDTVVLLRATQPRSAVATLAGDFGPRAGEPLEEVHVTGSRIARRDLQAPSPIVTVDRQAFMESSTLAVETVLNRLPQFVPIETQFITGDIFPTATNTPGATTLNLRGLGENRTLTLIDGRRTQPANSTLVIDMNSIPSSAIESVEVISGGASAVYGADAMAGVVNFKFKDRYEGVSVELRTGITERGDGEENRVAAFFGANTSDDRGNVMLGLEWMERGAALAIDHPFFAGALVDSGAPGTLARLNLSSYQPNAAIGGLPSQEAVDALFPNRPAGVEVSRATPFHFNVDDSIFKDAGALNYNGPLGDGRFKMQPNGTLGENNLEALRSSPMQRFAMLARAHYDLNDDVAVFGRANFVNADVLSLATPSSATGSFAVRVPRDDAHPVPEDLARLLDSRGPNVYSTTQFDPATGEPVVETGIDADWLLGRPLDFLPTRQMRNTAQLYQMVAGLEGRLRWRDWTWEAYVSHGETTTDSGYIGFASLQRYTTVVRAPYYGRDLVIEGPGQTSLRCTTGLPIFEEFEVSQDCIDAITIDLVDRTRLTQGIVEANLQGGLADLPAGELRGAVGASYRRNEFVFQPDALRESNSIVDIPVGAFGNATIKGATNVREVYAELLVPVLRGRRFAESLDLELGVRYSQYDTAGSVPTYKGLFSWAPSPHLRLRGGYQLANRAPNINELFLGASSVPVTMRGPDPCRADTLDENGNVPGNPHRERVQALCSAIIGTGTSTFDNDPDNFIGDGRTDGGEIELRSGNPGLDSERGETYTAGFVLASPFGHPALSDASLTVDWYRVKITGAISQVSAQTTYDLCFNRDGLSNPEYSLDDPNGLCRRIVRHEVTGNRWYVNSPYANLGTLKTSGFDVQASWRAALSDLGLAHVPGAMSLDLSLNRLLTFKSQDYPTQPPRENADTLARGGQFTYRALTTLRYWLGGGYVGLTWQHLPSVRSAAAVTDPDTPFRGAQSYDIFYLAAGWTLNRHVSLTLGIDNLFDRAPNRVGAGPSTNAAGNTATGYYDVLGRRYYMGLRMEF